MHVQSIRLRNFKRFGRREFNFFDEETGLARPLVVLVGENGSGKSTILQAIAATLGAATQRLHQPSDLDWPGFDLELVGTSWNLPSEVGLDVSFSTEELASTVRYFESIPGLEGRTQPGQDVIASLTLRDGKVEAANSSQYFQFRGREYAKQVVKIAEEGHGVFDQVGTVFWYTEHRTSTSLTAEVATSTNGDDPNHNGGYLHFDDKLLRRRLADLMQFQLRFDRNEYQLRPGQRTIFADIQRGYASIFPNRRFEGAVPRSDVDEVLNEPWFFLYDGNHQYEISEMSGGERAIFPLIFDFANWRINNSVILIDEIELHLHPPLQQALLRALPDLGRNNQFIITSHSDWIVQNVPPDSVYRMEGAE